MRADLIVAIEPAAKDEVVQAFARVGQRTPRVLGDVARGDVRSRVPAQAVQHGDPHFSNFVILKLLLVSREARPTVSVHLVAILCTTRAVCPPHDAVSVPLKALGTFCWLRFS